MHVRVYKAGHNHAILEIVRRGASSSCVLHSLIVVGPNVCYCTRLLVYDNASLKSVRRIAIIRDKNPSVVQDGSHCGRVASSLGYLLANPMRPL
jgi:hypothetical protein